MGCDECEKSDWCFNKNHGFCANCDDFTDNVDNVRKDIKKMCDLIIEDIGSNLGNVGSTINFREIKEIIKKRSGLYE